MGILGLIQRWRDRADSPPVAGQGRPEQRPRNVAGKWPDATSLLVQRMTGMYFDPGRLGNNTSEASEEQR